jgi:hypothetical protein
VGKDQEETFIMIETLVHHSLKMLEKGIQEKKSRVAWLRARTTDILSSMSGITKNLQAG